jgi:DNA-directed RNA polymerase specialized sigma24 family protein
MDPSGSITHWIGQLKAGEQAAAQPLWEAYFQRLVGLARRKLQGVRDRATDGEDVALSAFDSFCRGAEHGRFPQLTDREDLWRLLVVITARKASDQRTRAQALKRGGGDVQGESVFGRQEDTREGDGGLEQVVGREPTPAFAAQVAEECARLLEKLADPGLRAVAIWKMEGNTTEEIAVKLGCVPRTVERKLRLIRSLWEESVP